MKSTTITSVTPPLESVILSKRVIRNSENMFNMGRPRLSQFKKMNKAIHEGDWKTAAVEGRDSRWHKQVTNRAERLMVRLEEV